MRHTYECPMRWADMDSLGHVNNVTYVDYLQEARIDMLASHAPVQGGERLAEGTVVVRHEVQYVSPLVHRRRPVRVESWVSEVRAASFTMAYEVVDDDDAGERRVHVQATTRITPFVFEEERPRRLLPEERTALSTWLEPGFDPAPAVPPLPEGGAAHEFPLSVRWSDVDAYGHVNNVTYFEYFQEARIAYVTDLQPEGATWSPWVVAHTDVDYRRPVRFRLEPYVVRSWFSHVGEKSAVLVGEIVDGEEVLARSRVVVVAFDREAQRAAPMDPGQHAVLLGQVRA